MKPIAIALIAFAVVGSAAEKHPENQSKQPVVVQQQSPLNLQFDRGTDQSPFVVANKQSAEDKADAHELSLDTDNLAKWTLRLAVASIAATLLAL